MHNNLAEKSYPLFGLVKFLARSKKAHNLQLCQLEYISDVSFVINNRFQEPKQSQNAPQRNPRYLNKENSTFLPETKIFY